jgi:MarR family transcriptional regulator, negative regulator of the multidrug operon emrRAB
MSAAADDDYQHFVSGILERADGHGFAHLSAMQVVFSLTTTASQITYDLEATVHRPRRLSWAAYRLLVVLAVSGPLDPTRAAPRAAMSRAAVSAVAKTLEGEGLITRKPSTVDGRSVVLSLTKRGRAVLAEAKAANNEREEAWCAVLDETERRHLVRLLRKLADQPTSTSVRQRG